MSRQDFLATQKEIYAATGVRPAIYRAPHGRVTPWMAAMLRNEGVRVIGWNLSPRDWRPQSPDALVRDVMGQVRPGAVVLLHDGINTNEGADRDVLLKALPMLISDLKQRGYRIVTVSEMLAATATSGR